MSPENKFNTEKNNPLFKDVIPDAAAFEIMFKKNFTQLCTYCQYKFRFDPELARDVVHNAFIRLWENRENLDRHRHAKAYLYKIVTNICLDILKHEKVRKKYEKNLLRDISVSIAVKDFESVDLKELGAAIESAIGGLPEQMRKIFVMSRYEGLKYAEIASRLNISVKTVETQMSRALVKLRDKLTRYLVISFIVFLHYISI